MDKLTYLSRLGPIPDYGYELTVFHGFVGCLTPSQATRAIDLTFEQQYRKRAAILRRILRDIRLEFQKCHAEFVDSLLKILPTLAANRRQSCGYVLSELHAVVPSPVKKSILQSFLSSPYVSLRKRGYKILRYGWNEKFASEVDRAWRRHHDPEAARLIVDRFSIEFLVNHLELLDQTIGSTWDRRRLFLRVVPAVPKSLNVLRATDQISYVYVAAKLKLRVSAREALAIFNRHMGDDDVGLLIWSFGQLSLWRTLQNIQSRLDEIGEARSAYITSKWELNQPTVRSRG
jgi:hypothetical protein